jgi:hypothetical protein
MVYKVSGYSPSDRIKRLCRARETPSTSSRTRYTSPGAPPPPPEVVLPPEEDELLLEELDELEELELPEELLELELLDEDELEPPVTVSMAALLVEETAALLASRLPL